jgi:hypothetical protein
VDHFDFRLSIVHDLLQAGSPSTMKSSSRIPASQKITRSAPPHNLPCPHCLPGKLPSTPPCPSAKRYQECIPHFG